MPVTLTTHGPFVVLTVVGLWLRLAGLERLPLSPAEAAHAWAAWAAVAGGACPDTVAASPLLFGVQYGLFTAVGASDTVARLGPAIAGASAMVAPWSLRGVLGQPVAVVLAALLAFDPLSIAWARTGTGAALTGAALWFTMAGALSVQAGAGRAGAVQSLAAVVLGVFTGPLAWGGVPIWAWAWSDTWALPARGWRRGLVGSVVVGLALMIRFGSTWPGPAFLPASLAKAIDGETGSAVMPVLVLGRALLADEVLPITLAVGAAFTPGGAGTRLAVGWLLLAATGLLVAARDGGVWLLAAPAVLLLAARTLVGIVTAWRESRGPARAPAPFVTAIAALLLVAVHVHRGTEVRLAPIDARPVVRPIHSDASVRPLARAVKAHLRGAVTRVLAVATPDGREDAVLAWYLRDIADLRWYSRLPEDASPSLTIATGPASARPAPSTYVLRHSDGGAVQADLR